MHKRTIYTTLITILLPLLFVGCGGGSSDEPLLQSTLENTSFTSTHFSGSQNCATCHNTIKDINQEDVSIESDWAGTMMANSSKDPLWRAKVASELKRNPKIEDVINDKCTKCHAPMANYEAHYISDEIKIFDDGFLNPQNLHFNEAMNGVSCSLCHQIDATNLGTLDGFSGHYTINSNREMYGQYGDSNDTAINQTPMQNTLNYTPTYAQHITESKMCAACHNLKTPFVDANGDVNSTTPESEFPEQMPYTEWEHSDFNSTTPKSCQECHMQRADGVVISNRPDNGSLPARDNFARHNFVGGNKLMLDILNQNRTALGVNPNANFTKILTRTEELLNNTATIALDKRVNGTTLSIDVNISINTGHKFPTSFPSRRAFIHLTLYDENNNTLFESGKVDTNGSIEGADSDIDSSTFEPHYDVITAENQVQIYEAVMQNTDNEVTYTLLRAASYIKDNRLLPRGFDKNSVPNDIAVIGNAKNSDSNFIGGSDMLTYDINSTNFTTAPHHVIVKLKYQTLAYPFAEDLFKDVNESQSFKSMFEASEMKTITISEGNLTL
ncbi:MAG: hypothetical protein JXQ67_01665 [Campylobacterales bacterium]|nr:hypothetical protein [Campylobacterales bacterium]